MKEEVEKKVIVDQKFQEVLSEYETDVKTKITKAKLQSLFTNLINVTDEYKSLLNNVLNYKLNDLDCLLDKDENNENVNNGPRNVEKVGFSEVNECSVQNSILNKMLDKFEKLQF